MHVDGTTAKMAEAPEEELKKATDNPEQEEEGEKGEEAGEQKNEPATARSGKKVAWLVVHVYPRHQLDHEFRDCDLVICCLMYA